MNPQQAQERYKILEPVIDMHANILTQIAFQTGTPLEGNCFTMHNTFVRNEDLISKRVNLMEIARHGKKILELGFNAGHSALLLLLGALPDTEITFVDIGIHPYVPPCFQYLNSKFPAAKLLLLGDSRLYLPQIVLKDNQREIYDVIHMDGGHDKDCVVNDMILLYLLLKKGGIMIVDDADGFILEQTHRFLQLGLFTKFEGQLPTKVYPHLIVQKV